MERFSDFRSVGLRKESHQDSSRVGICNQSFSRETIALLKYQYFRVVYVIQNDNGIDEG